jgi:hypothetical protein
MTASRAIRRHRLTWAAAAALVLSCLLSGGATAHPKAPYCNYPSNYYPAMCGSRQEATDTCAEEAADGNKPEFSHLRLRLIPNSQEDALFFHEREVGVCHYAGNRQLSYVEQLRTGPSGSFVPIGTPTTAIADGIIAVQQKLAPALSCSARLAGSAIREVVTVHWIPKAGWGRTPTTYPYTRVPMVWGWASPAVVVC